MATLKQIEAARRNGARSKGPVTSEGKARVAQNGATHGIYSQTVVLHNEDRSLYLESCEAHIAEWNPATETEHNLVTDIVDARWRLRRLSALETAALDFEIERMRPEIAETFERIDEATRSVLAFNALISNNRTFEVIQTSVRTQHRIIDRAVRALLRLRDLRGPAPQDPTGDDTSTNRSRRPAPASTTALAVVPPAATQDTAPEPPAPATPGSTVENPGTEPEPARPEAAAPAKSLCLVIGNARRTRETAPEPAHPSARPVPLHSRPAATHLWTAAGRAAA